jgi:hypothetical protein
MQAGRQRLAEWNRFRHMNNENQNWERTQTHERNPPGPVARGASPVLAGLFAYDSEQSGFDVRSGIFAGRVPGRVGDVRQAQSRDDPNFLCADRVGRRQRDSDSGPSELAAPATLGTSSLATRNVSRIASWKELAKYRHGAIPISFINRFELIDGTCFTRRPVVYVGRY